jgi:bifunctional non-homologous end joining protein LigD
MKYDGYRGLLYVEHGAGRFVSRNERVMRRFATLAQSLAQVLRVETAILDGEIITKDAAGRPIFLDLMRRRDEATYVAFDLVWLNGRDLRGLPLLERKRALRRISPRRSRLIEEALCVPDRGLDLFRMVAEHDLEGVIAKRKDGPYATSSPWLKIKNPGYSQAEGRGELFRR